MARRCAVCWQPLPADPRRITTIAAAGRPLVAVHSGNCAETVGSLTRTGGMFAIFAARRALATKAPRVSALLESFAAFRRQQLEEENRLR